MRFIVLLPEELLQILVCFDEEQVVCFIQRVRANQFQNVWMPEIAQVVEDALFVLNILTVSINFLPY